MFRLIIFNYFLCFPSLKLLLHLVECRRVEFIAILSLSVSRNNKCRLNKCFDLLYGPNVKRASKESNVLTK